MPLAFDPSMLVYSGNAVAGIAETVRDLIAEVVPKKGERRADPLVGKGRLHSHVTRLGLLDFNVGIRIREPGTAEAFGERRRLDASSDVAEHLDRRQHADAVRQDEAAGRELRAEVGVVAFLAVDACADCEEPAVRKRALVLHEDRVVVEIEAGDRRIGLSFPFISPAETLTGTPVVISLVSDGGPAEARHFCRRIREEIRAPRRGQELSRRRAAHQPLPAHRTPRHR